jgi:hypothetical protein
MSTLTITSAGPADNADHPIEIEATIKMERGYSRWNGITVMGSLVNRDLTKFAKFTLDGHNLIVSDLIHNNELDAWKKTIEDVAAEFDAITEVVIRHRVQTRVIIRKKD